MARLQAHLTESNCKQQHVYPYTTRDIPKPIHYFYHPALTARFSFNSLNVANAINIWVGLESIWTA